MSKKMHTEPRIEDPDDFYVRLIKAYHGLSTTESQALSARLILLMANQIGDRQVLDEILIAARTATKPTQ